MDNLTRLQSLLHYRFGLHFSPEKHIDLVSGVQQAMRQTGFTDVVDYTNHLEMASPDHPLWRGLISHITVGETYFFRDMSQFRALQNELLPKLITQRRKAGQLKLRLWSAGCATGEEAYTLAIMLRELLPDIDQWHISILGTDIHEAALDKARSGVYGDWSFRMETPLAFRQKYFIIHKDSFEITPEVRCMVDFYYFNLAEKNYPWNEPFDIILCRNVTIYFDRPTTQAVVGRFYDVLMDGGWLVVGHSEPLASIYKAYEFHSFPNTVVYRKPLTEALPPKRKATAPLSIKMLPESARLSEHEQKNQIEEVYRLMRQQDLIGARYRLNRFLELMPKHIEALLLLAKISADEGQLDWVHEILDTIEELNPLVPQAHYLRALLYQQKAAWDAAKSALRRALYADREFALAHYSMGELLYTEGNQAMARRSWQNALALLQKWAPDFPVPYGDGILAGTLVHTIERRLSKL